jgi:UDP-glucose 4-epimerase
VTDLAAAHVDALRHLRTGGENLTLNCGYGRGFSVLEVVEAVRQVSETDFPVRIGPRRPGDPATLVARASRIRERLGWQPRYDNLPLIVAHALAWERTIPAKPSVAA